MRNVFSSLIASFFIKFKKKTIQNESVKFQLKVSNSFIRTKVLEEKTKIIMNTCIIVLRFVYNRTSKLKQIYLFEIFILVH
jgi:hypothetical protein